METSKALGENYKVFQLRFETGEYDMVIRNKKNDTCAVYEIKHSDKLVREQARHLRNPEMLRLTSPRFGKLVGRFVLYLGRPEYGRWNRLSQCGVVSEITAGDYAGDRSGDERFRTRRTGGGTRTRARTYFFYVEQRQE